MFQAFRSSHSPAPDWKSGLTGRSQLNLTKEAEISSQSPLVDFVLLAPTSSPGRGGTIDETPKIGLITIGARPELKQVDFKREMGARRLSTHLALTIHPS
jgi:hypothetical protein